MNDIARKPIPTGIRWVGGFTAAVLVAQLGLNQPLQTSAAPQGMLSFQLATTGEGAAAIVESWGTSFWAETSLWSGFLFAALYTTLLILLTNHLLVDRPGVRERKTGQWVRGLFVVAGLAHVTEYSVLLANLDAPSDRLSLAATLLALTNYTALLVGIAGLVVIRAARRHPLHPPGARESAR
ncbi:hypothetical protein SAMN04487962_11240 [Marinobacter segnicrescens]|uniref:Uncharacterized protein n=1 Tax=Marinobacter segnicrescens TaxID=430453 RepID=A0A1I0FBI8_9GAMM|nr:MULTISPECIES: hypothetical protein [Marinobacter]UZD65188.1 hypothetical protein LJ360_16625 [Marinobacter sp. AN1]SET55223.1 hypothetical protein SAMN04487962_11240 [Marinobacter segnicrescens]